MIIQGRAVLVRHALPVVDEATPPSLWALTEEGHLAAHQLASRLRLSPNALVWASNEIKALQTAEALSDQVKVDPRLREVQRPWSPDRYGELAEAWLRGGEVEEWESMDSAIERFRKAVTDAIEKGEGSACLVTHGLIMSAYLGAVAGVDPVTLWSELEFPDVRTLDFGALEVS